jgi:hypothetical protein
LAQAAEKKKRRAHRRSDRFDLDFDDRKTVPPFDLLTDDIHLRTAKPLGIGLEELALGHGRGDQERADERDENAFAGHATRKNPLMQVTA